MAEIYGRSPAADRVIVPPPKYTWAAEAAKLRETGAKWETIGRKFGVSEDIVRGVVRRWLFSQPAEAAKPEFTIYSPPTGGLAFDELVADRIKRFTRKKQHEEARKLIPVKLRDNSPIGILHFGDPHVDDDGTDLGLLMRHADLVSKTDGLYGANVGDTTNNWIGRLAKLYAEQTTTENEAWVLAEGFIRRVGRKWLYLVGGNHDAWSGVGDPLKWITREVGALYQDSEVRIAVRFPSGEEVRINCRHDFEGSSQWNPAHGPGKALQMGSRDHLAIAGHRHISAHNLLKDPDTGILMHAVRVASYKVFDRYAREKGFRDQSFGPACVTTLDPALPENHPDKLKIFWDPFEGAEFLTFLRRRRRAA